MVLRSSFLDRENALQFSFFNVMWPLGRKWAIMLSTYSGHALSWAAAAEKEEDVGYYYYYSTAFEVSDRRSEERHHKHQFHSLTMPWWLLRHTLVKYLADWLAAPRNVFYTIVVCLPAWRADIVSSRGTCIQVPPVGPTFSFPHARGTFFIIFDGSDFTEETLFYD